ncbi:uncharacterized protein LOC133201003 [Saccostrea echinata]|uniref:uncharacterized protein LOC133201003 n=1 Tax=Saccostrea echinata TaxID=191078 RepID=UPI002A7F7BF0|nr:uncharacterized protein LOC133201003 [Saccostrea echinata]
MWTTPFLLVLCCSLLADSHKFSQIRTEFSKQIDAEYNIRESRALRHKRMINEDPPEGGNLGPLLPPDPVPAVTSPKPTPNSKRKTKKNNRKKQGPKKAKKTKTGRQGQGPKKSERGTRKSKGKGQKKNRKVKQA